MRTSAWLATSAIVILVFGFGHAGCYTSGTPGGSGAGGAAPQGGSGGTVDGGGTGGNDAGTGGAENGGSTTCTSDADCNLVDGKPVCLLSAHTCVACLEDIHCNTNSDDAGSSSQSSQYCFHNACLSFVFCQRTTQCVDVGASGGSASSGGSTAVGGGNAGAGGAATGGSVETGGAAATGGAVSTGIVGTSVCDPTLGYCVQCSQDNDCRAQTNVQGLNCRVNRCRASCGSDLDCLKIDGTLLCNLALGVCTEECNSNSDCYPGHQCDMTLGKCVPKS